MIRIATLDEFEPTIVKALANSLYAAFGVGAEFTAHVPFPPELEDPPPVHALMKALPRVEAFSDDRVLYLTSRKLAARKLISGEAPTQGLAEYDGRNCIVSTADVGALTPETIAPLARLAIQEIGHTFGLHHCLDPRCSMYPQWTLSRVAGAAVLCTYCRDKSEQRIRQLKS